MKKNPHISLAILLTIVMLIFALLVKPSLTSPLSIGLFFVIFMTWSSTLVHLMVSKIAIHRKNRIFISLISGLGLTYILALSSVRALTLLNLATTLLIWLIVLVVLDRTKY